MELILRYNRLVNNVINLVIIDKREHYKDEIQSQYRNVDTKVNCQNKCGAPRFEVENVKHHDKNCTSEHREAHNFNCDFFALGNTKDDHNLNPSDNCKTAYNE